jgi:hypothetical protein
MENVQEKWSRVSVWKRLSMRTDHGVSKNVAAGAG